MAHHVRVAGIQFNRRFGDVAYNVGLAAEMVREAAAGGAQIVALPELFSTGYIPCKIDQDLFGIAEPIPGPTINKMMDLARELDIYLIAPIWEIDQKFETYYNGCAVIAPGGLLGRYRKRHIPSMPGMQERHYFAPGNVGYPVFESPWCRFGVLICYDRHFPESYRHLALRGAEVVFVPSNTPTAFSNRNWIPEMHANCVANGIYICQVNVVGPEEGINWFGLSTIMSPKAEILDQLKDQPGIVAAELDFDVVREVRRHYGSIRDTDWSDLGLTSGQPALATSNGSWDE